MEQYRVTEILVVPVGPKSSLFSNFEGRSTGVYPSSILILLDKCRQFKTLQEHSHEIWTKLGFRERRKYYRDLLEAHFIISDEVIISFTMFEKILLGLFQHFKDQGLLISKEQFIKYGDKGNNASDFESKISTIAIITSDRIENLRVGLNGFIDNCQSHNRSPNYLVLDDSRGEEKSLEYKQFLKHLSQNHKVKISYAGVSEKKKFIEKCAENGVDPDITEFALLGDRSLGPTYGANRNCFLLGTIGENSLCTDDDVLCQFAPSPTQKKGLTLATDRSLDVFAFMDREKALNSTHFTKNDCLSIHEGILGEGIHSLLSKNLNFISDLDVEGLNARMIKEIRRGQSRVVATFPGIIGDSGSGSSQFYLFLERESRKRLLTSKENFYMALESREMTKSSENTLIVPAKSCMTTLFGIDNRNILPPFFPLFRNEDALFAELINITIEGALFAHLPWVFHHSPPDIRKNESGLSAEAPGLSMDEVIKIAFSDLHFGQTIDKPSDRIRLAGQHLQRFAKLSQSQRLEAYHNYTWSVYAAKISSFETLLNSTPTPPDFMIKEIKKIIKEMKNFINKPISLAPSQIVNLVGSEKADNLTIDLFIKYGRLLESWPELYRVAKKLKDQGSGLAQLIS